MNSGLKKESLKKPNFGGKTLGVRKKVALGKTGGRLCSWGKMGGGSLEKKTAGPLRSVGNDVRSRGPPIPVTRGNCVAEKTVGVNRGAAGSRNPMEGRIRL